MTVKMTKAIGATVIKLAWYYWQEHVPEQPFADFLPQSKYIVANKYYEYDDDFVNIAEVEDGTKNVQG